MQKKIAYAKPAVLAMSNGYYSTGCEGKPKNYNTPTSCKLER